MDLFWLKGYEATSLDDLVEHMGIGRQSLYNTFGDKHRLFLATLDRYRRERLERGLARLEAQDASVDVIQEVCNTAVEFYGSDRRSCFLANSTLELGCKDEEVAQIARAYATRMENAFLNAITNAVKGREIRTDKNPRALARHLTNSVCGITVLAKAGTSRKALRDAMEVALSVFE
jgi:TetR/AcrR family transcriptional repressor of nem operon